MSIAALDVWIPTQDASVRTARSTSPLPRTVLTLVWACVALFAAEGGLRLRSWYRHGSSGPVADVYESDSTLGRRPRPGAMLRGRERNASINRWGFRGAEVGQQKPSGTIRIAALGDSTTFALEAPDDASVWVARLVERLNAVSNGARFDAINAAVPGYTLQMSCDRLRRDVEPLDPDVVIVLQTATDIAAHSRRQFRVVLDHDPASTSLSKTLQEHSLLVNLVRQNTAPWLARWMPQRRYDRLDERGLDEFRRRLTELVERVRDRSRRVVLCTTPRSFGDPSATDDQYALAATALANNPSLSLAGLNDAYDRYNDAVRRVAQETSAALVDLAALIPKDGSSFVDATHLSDAGHVRVAELIADRLLAEPLRGALAGTTP